MPINKLFKRQTPPQNVEKDVGGMELLFNNLLVNLTRNSMNNIKKISHACFVCF